jgi:hypothetical protein
MMLQPALWLPALLASSRSRILDAIKAYSSEKEVRSPLRWWELKESWNFAAVWYSMVQRMVK